MATKKKAPVRKSRTRSKASAITEDSTSKEIRKVAKKAARKVEKKSTKKTAKDRSAGFSFEDIKDVKGVKEYKFEILNKANREKKKYDYRIPFNNIALQSISGGIIGGTFCELAAESQGGKCLAKGTLVATVKGPRPIESLAVGDMVFGYNADGSTSPVKVTDTMYNGRKAVHELRNKHNIFAEATLEHNWASTNVRGDKETQHEVSTDQLFKSKEYRVNKRFVDYEFGNVSEPHAYVIGALLGDGCSRQGVSNIHISSPDDKVPKKIQSILGAKECYKQSDDNFTYVISNGKGKGFNHDKVMCNMYDDYVKDKYSHEKSLPFDVFADWDRESLLNLLAGLIDTDGSVCLTNEKHLTLSFSSTSDQLAELYRTLIYTIFQVEPRLHMDVREDKRDCFDYRVGDNPTVTRILQKLGNRIETDSKKYQPEYDKLPFHVSEKYTGVTQGRSRIADVYDITVDNETHMFVLHSGLVTHNSFLAYELMANTQAMGGVVILNDGEGAFDENYAKMVGLNIDDGTFIITRIANIQKYYSFQINVITAIRSKKGCKQIPILSVCDSFPTLNTIYALEARGDGKQLGFESKLKNRAWTEQMETFVPFLKETMATHIMINQFTKVDVANKYMNPYVSLCESKMQYWATQRFKGMLKGNITKEVWIGPKDASKKNLKKVKIGMRTEWESIKNRSVKPFQKATVDILYSHGISKYSGLAKMLMDNEMAVIKSSKYCANTGEELSKAKDYLQIQVKLVGEDNDVRITYHKALGSTNKELAKLIKDYPKAIEPIWTGSYDDGEIYEIEDFSDEELNERNNPTVTSETEEEAVEA